MANPEENNPVSDFQPEKINTEQTADTVSEAANAAGENMILENGGMDVTEDRYSDIVDSSYVGDDELDDFSSTRELRFEMFTEEFDKKFREMFSDSLDNEDKKMGAKKMRDIKVVEEEEEEPIPEPPAWAPPSLVEQIEKDAKKRQKQKKKQKNRKKRTAIWVFFLLLFLGIFAFAAYKFGVIYLAQLKEKENLDKLAETVAEVVEQPVVEEPVVEEEPVEVEPQVLAKYKELSDSNSDMIGWLSIPGMDIDYPVMYTPDDPEYYLRRDFNGEDATAGMLFVDANCDPVDGDNQIIYGHNMRNGTMFGTLSNYADKDFWEDHQYIHYDSLYEEHVYQVVCVFQSWIRYVNEEGFRYYRFYGSSNEEEFNDYVTNIKELQLYDTGLDINYGDKLITLSTCAYFTEDGRFVVVAKQIS